jgi:hypothetical protein
MVKQRNRNVCRVGNSSDANRTVRCFIDEEAVCYLIVLPHPVYDWGMSRSLLK